MNGLQNREAFYAYVSGNAGELFPDLRKPQYIGCDALLTLGAGRLPLSWMAYVLATCYHETNRTMEPVKEAYWLSEEWRKKHLRYFPWYGRGFVQLTWEFNYRFASERLQSFGISVDLLARPDDALLPAVAAAIAVFGMIEGWFSKKKLRDFLNNNPSREQYEHARQIINGKDKATLIAGYAIEFEKGLKLGDWR